MLSNIINNRVLEQSRNFLDGRSFFGFISTQLGSSYTSHQKLHDNICWTYCRDVITYLYVEKCNNNFGFYENDLSMVYKPPGLIENDLKNNINKTLAFMEFVEGKIPENERSIYQKCFDPCFCEIQLGSFWKRNYIAFSLFSFLLREGTNYNFSQSLDGVPTKVNIEKFILKPYHYKKYNFGAGWVDNNENIQSYSKEEMDKKAYFLWEKDEVKKDSQYYWNLAEAAARY